MSPFLLSVMFADPDLTAEENSDEPETHCYLSIIIASSGSEALSWGQKLAEDLVQDGEAKFIEEVWVEECLPQLVTMNGLVEFNWLSLSAKEKHFLTFGSAIEKTSSIKINAAVQGGDGQLGKQVWEYYLRQYKPTFVVESWSLGLPPITSVRKPINWNDWG